MGNYQEALNFFQKAVELDSTNLQAWVGLATVYEIQKEPERALEIYRQLLRGDSENLRLREKIISVLSVVCNRACPLPVRSWTSLQEQSAGRSARGFR